MYTDMQMQTYPKPHTVAPGPLEELRSQLKWYVHLTSLGDAQLLADPHPAPLSKGQTVAAGRPHPLRWIVPPATHPWSGCSEGIPSAVSGLPARQEPGVWEPQDPLRSS